MTFSVNKLQLACFLHDDGRGRPAQPTLPLTRRLKLEQVKHSTKDTLLPLTGQSTASFFIFARAFPFTAPFIALRVSLGAGIAFGTSTTSTVYLSSGVSLNLCHADCMFSLAAWSDACMGEVINGFWCLRCSDLCTLQGTAEQISIPSDRQPRGGPVSARANSADTFDDRNRDSFGPLAHDKLGG